MRLHFIQRFLRDERGVSAVEFALTVPILLISLLGVVDIGTAVYKRSDMEAALRSGVQYFMNGGEEMATAEAVVLDSWTTKPDTMTVVADKLCLCGAVSSSCNALCGDGSTPATYNRIQATALFPGILMDDTYASEQSVRTR
jgi:Flp pilus assembly protein TadG